MARRTGDAGVTDAVKGPVVLIVDDEQGIRDVVSTVARRVVPMVNVMTAPDGFAAERIVREEDVRGILTDLRMPGRSGLELLEIVARVSPKTRRALMTGFQEDIIDGVALAELGLIEILRKPFRTSELRKVLGELIA